MMLSECKGNACGVKNVWEGSQRSDNLDFVNKLKCKTTT